MEIYLNGQRLDFTLEGESTIAEVAAALERWLAGGALCVTAVAVDGTPRQAAEWPRLAVEGTARVDLTVAPVTEARASALRTAAEFLRLMERAVGARDERLLGELAPGYPALVEGIRSILAPRPREPLHDHLLALDRLLAGNTPERIAAWPAETTAAAVAALAGIAAGVAAGLEEVDDPARALPRVRAALAAALPELERVSVLLQTGKDREAMAAVVGCSQLTEALLSIVARLSADDPAALLVAGRPAPEFQAELNGILRQLVEAFGARDTVLIGDLLEYEAAPRLRSLVEAAAALEGGAATRG